MEICTAALVSALQDCNGPMVVCGACLEVDPALLVCFNDLDALCSCLGKAAEPHLPGLQGRRLAAGATATWASAARLLLQLLLLLLPAGTHLE
jgi:hypothetical protein